MSTPGVITRRRTGYIPDPFKRPNERPDWSYDLLRSTRSLKRTPGPTDLRAFNPGILDQGPIGSCVANAVFGAIRLRLVKMGIKNPRLGARLFGYLMARAYIGQEKLDYGCHIRDFIRGIQKYGFVPEDEYPFGYDTSRFAELPANLEEILRAAYDQRNKTDLIYTRIYETGSARIERVCEALDNGYPIVFGAQISDEFKSFDRGVKVFDPPARNAPTSGHAMYLVAHGVGAGRSDTVTGAGSWGPDAHDNGYHHFSFDYVMQFIDLWAMEVPPWFSGVLV